MKRFLFAAVAAAASSASMATVTLVPRLTAPAEMQLGEYAEYTLAVTNTGNEWANNTVLRMELIAGMDAQLPLPDGCDEVTEALAGQAGVRQLRCATAVPAFNKSRSFTVIMKAPPNAPLSATTHKLYATADFAAAPAPFSVTTLYSSFHIPITPNTLWEYRACSNGTAGPLAYDMCPSSSEAISKLNLQTGGSLLASRKTGTTTWGAWVANLGTWLQTDPDTAQLRWYPGKANEATVNLHPINSNCFRGRGTSLAGTFITAKLCKL